MIIDSNNNVNSTATANARTRQTTESQSTAAKSAPPAKPADSDSVSLSVKAQTMGRLEAQIADASEVDEDKVAAIKAAISEGRYQVDSRTIAERMLNQDNLFG